jgi:RimJ/RimL family protein N-acetyltransferase
MRTLLTDRLELRAARPADFDQMHRLLVDELEGPEFDRPAFAAEMAFDEALNHQPLGEWFGRPALFLRRDGRYVGFCTLMPRLCSASEQALWRIPRDGTLTTARGGGVEVEIGWAIGLSCRRRGLATEAACALLEYARRILCLDRVVAFTDGANEASVAVMRRLGMELHPSGSDIAGVAWLSRPTVGELC